MNYQKVYIQLCLYYKALNLKKDPSQPGALEQHHILPKACHGKDDISNLVILPVKAHFVAHHLLSKIYKNTIFQYQVDAAYCCMCFMPNKRNKQNQYKVTSRQYAEARKLCAAISHSRTGIKMPEGFSEKMSQILTGRKLSESHRKNISKGMTGLKHPGVSAALKGRKRNKEITEKIRMKLKGRKYPEAGAKISAKLKGQKHSIERRLAQSQRQKGKPTKINYDTIRGVPRTEEVKQKLSAAWKYKKEHGYVSPMKGRKQSWSRTSEYTEKQRKAFKGRIWITNGKINKYIFLTGPLPDGFIKGRIINGQLHITKS